MKTKIKVVFQVFKSLLGVVSGSQKVGTYKDTHCLLFLGMIIFFLWILGYKSSN